ncbi:TPA: hypothetical protein TY277_001120 [Streptococcus suis]|nr:hypothetical protein [Streptococcus hyointestinalis]MDD6385152.1 hypothetical protein [Streptococcus hyointestinalis]HEL1965250.1 hypothetical protein [Streptococcus suis]HEL1983681.1 hypothetical protein [Streptococcus suis]HEL1989875.1 hypothetical protein [Streptococcus suis]
MTQDEILKNFGTIGIGRSDVVHLTIVTPLLEFGGTYTNHGHLGTASYGSAPDLWSGLPLLLSQPMIG